MQKELEGNVKKIKKKKSFLHSSLLRESFVGFKRYIVIGAIAVICANVAAYMIPLVISFVVDYMLKDDGTQLPAFFVNLASSYGRDFFLGNMWIPALVLLGFAIISGIFIFIRMRCSAEISEGVAKKMRDRLYHHLQNVSYDYYKRVSAGDIVQRCTSDVDTIRRFVSVQMMEIFRAFVMVVIALVIMLNLNVKMAFISIAALPVLFLFSYIFFNKIKVHFTLSDEAEGAISTVLQENLSGVRVVRAFGQQQNEVERFEVVNTEYRKVTTKMVDLLGWYWGLSDFIGYLQIALSLILGIIFAVRGELSLGSVITFSTYTGMLTWPVRQLGRILTDFGKSIVSLGRLEEITDVPLESEPGKALIPPIKGDIKFVDAMFGYDYPNEVLDGVSFEVKAGQTVAILGSTGSGKSSLVHLLQRLYETTGGGVYVDGVNVNDIERHHLRKNIGIVLQEPFLYSRSILENIRIADPEADEAAVFEAAGIASIHDVIQSFEKGYDTVVGERGVTVSGGQKQRIAIARMLMQNAPILVFDDSLSAVDTETDAAIRAALTERKKYSTTFLISHRITTLCESDFIIVLEKGKIVQQGTHEELLKEEGLYRRIAEIQAALPEEALGEEDSNARI